MIVTENTPRSPQKNSTTPLLGEQSGSGPPPPAYVPRDVPAGASQAGPYTTVYTAPVYPQAEVVHDEPAGKRFLKAFVVALGLWFLASMLIGSMTESMPRRHRNQNLGSSDYPIPSDMGLHDCVTGWSTGTTTQSGFPHSVTTSFNFPLPSENLLLLSKGALSSGHLKVTTADISGVKVKVTVHYHREAIRDVAKVCMISRKDGEAGVGVFTPRLWQRRGLTEKLSFDVELILPRGRSSAQHINAFTTDVNNFSHDIDSLEGFVNFGTLTLKGSNGKITAGYLGASSATLSTSNGAVKVWSLVAPKAAVNSSNGGISGLYVVNDSLDLNTSNGAIDVSVEMTPSDNSDSPHLTMHTSNTLLKSIINLHTSSSTGGAFPIKATTSNGHLSTTIASLPLDATLSLDARTSNAHAEVLLPSTYEGAFSVSTSNAEVVVSRDSKHERDPACPTDGTNCSPRSRTVAITSPRKPVAVGRVFWDKANENRGDVKLTTSNSPVRLTL